MHDHFWYHASKEEPKQAQREPEVRPVVPVLHNIQRITVEVDVTVEVHLVERLHGNLAPAAVFGAIRVFMEIEIMLNR